MRRVLLGILISACVAGSARAQFFKNPSDLLPTTGILRNSVTNLHAEGDSLWVGPFLSFTSDGGENWFVADSDSLAGSRNSVFSLDVEGPVIWAGLGYSTVEDGVSVPAVSGYLNSTDGGRTFTFRNAHLDAPEDTAVSYGASTLPALAVIVPEQSPPYDIDYDPVTGDVWIAAWASGIRRSPDDGRTWQRVVLPPDSIDFIHPDSSYRFEVAPRRGSTGNFNHMGFSVLVDEEGMIWAGTPRGVNRSADGLAWRRFSADGTAQSLTGSWVTSIEEQPLPGRNPIWMATWNAGDLEERGRFGVTVTRDGGGSFEQYLIGERIHDFAFQGNTTVYAAGENGLFISDDDGITWRSVRRFKDAEDPSRIVRPDVNVFAVATTRDALWAGTSDGLMKSEDGGETWRVHRTDVPLHPEEPSAAVPDVDTYAYPNPFSPQSDRFVRIRYESDGGTDRVRIFDFRMNLVRDIASDGASSGVRELTWDGMDDDGFRVANGVYFYAIDASGDVARGKIHVIE